MKKILVVFLVLLLSCENKNQKPLYKNSFTGKLTNVDAG